MWPKITLYYIWKKVLFLKLILKFDASVVISAYRNGVKYGFLEGLNFLLWLLVYSNDFLSSGSQFEYHRNHVLKSIWISPTHSKIITDLVK